MIYLHLGCDEYLSSQRILELKRELGDAEMADLNTSTLQGDRATAADVLGEASMMPFLAVKRLVLVYGLLDSLDKRMAASKGTDGAAYQMAAQLLSGLEALPETCDVILVDESVDKRRGLWKGFTLSATEKSADRKIPGLADLIKAKVITQEDLATPDPKALAGWLHGYARSQAIAIEGQATQTLAEFVGPNLRQLHNELHKLATFAGQRPITVDDVKLLVSDASEALIWNLTDALSQRNGRRAMHSLYELRRGDANAFYLLTMVARQYRILLKVKSAMHKTRGNEYDIAKVVGEKPYSVKKAMGQSNSYTQGELIDIMERLLEADFAMKTGADPETEIDLLIAELTQKRNRTP
ncbi:MAG: DNA polymerase III subunit delta [Caldilineaceae bacterium]|nr:DNA polymerase III subunit delta [Caldilineaceae bacterium]